LDRKKEKRTVFLRERKERTRTLQGERGPTFRATSKEERYTCAERFVAKAPRKEMKNKEGGGDGPVSGTLGERKKEAVLILARKKGKNLTKLRGKKESFAAQKPSPEEKSSRF